MLSHLWLDRKAKGVQIQHRGCATAAAQIDAFNHSPVTVFCNSHPLSFDASIFEIVAALLTGATLCLAKRESLCLDKP